MFGNPSNVQLIKEIGGSGVYWPAVGVNSIGLLQPGRAYLLRSNGHFSVEFPICDNSKSGSLSTVFRPDNPTNWGEINYTSSTHVIAFDDKLMAQLGAGNYVGAFTASGLCAGIAEIDLKGSALTVFGNDQFTMSSDGFTEEELIGFKLFDVATGQTHDLEVMFDTGFGDHNGTFRTNGISRVISATAGSLSINPVSEIPLSVYPNPTSGHITISGLSSDGELKIYSTDGQLLKMRQIQVDDLHNQTIHLSLYDYPSGIYYIRIIQNQRTEVRKVIKQ